MKEYIELKAAVELAMQYCPDDDGTCSKADRDIRELLDELENLPSIQLNTPLVRCKDCEHDISSQFDTDARCILWGCLKPKRGFCDAGKKREE